MRRLRRLIRRHKWVIPAAFLAVVIIIGVGIWIVKEMQDQESQHVTSSDTSYMGSGFREVAWKGQKYKFNNQLITILLAGLDSDDEMTELKRYTLAPQADSIQLLVLDPQNKQLRIVALNRDTMTMIRKFALDGMDRGLMKDHLALAFTYGNGGKVSCTNLCEAVSHLLYDIPIRDYVVINRASLGKLAQIIGPVEVTVPNDDLAAANEAYSTGQTVTIDESNIEYYLRSRDTEVSQSNVGRMERQKSYINAAMNQFLDRIEREPTGVWNDLEKLESCMQTDITRSRYLELVNAAADIQYSDADYLTPEGEQATGDFFDEFYVDQEALIEMVLNLFYIAQ